MAQQRVPADRTTEPLCRACPGLNRPGRVPAGAKPVPYGGCDVRRLPLSPVAAP